MAAEGAWADLALSKISLGSILIGDGLVMVSRFIDFATLLQSTSFALFVRLMPRNSSLQKHKMFRQRRKRTPRKLGLKITHFIAPINGYLTLPPQTSPLKSSISTVHTIAPA